MVRRFEIGKNVYKFHYTIAPVYNEVEGIQQKFRYKNLMNFETPKNFLLYPARILSLREIWIQKLLFISTKRMKLYFIKYEFSIVFWQTSFIISGSSKNNSPELISLISQKKTHLLTFELVFHQLKLANLCVYKILILNERLEWYKKPSLFAYRATQSNSVILAATFLKWKNEKLELETYSRS